MRAVDPLPPRRRRFLLPGLIAAAVLLTLLALGTWQLERRAWKEDLLAKLNARLTAQTVPLPPPAEWPRLDRTGSEFRRVAFAAEFVHESEALVYAAGSALRAGAPTGPGYFVFTPARLASGGLVLVNRGFVPEERREAAVRTDGQIAGKVEIVGALRWPETPSLFSPAGDPEKNLWFVRDPAAIAAAKGLAAASFYVEQEAPVPPGGWPRPASLKPNLPNNHLQYALTWYALAVVLVIVFAAWAFGRGGDRGRSGWSLQ